MPDVIQNGSFERGWTDIVASANLVNQQPNFWGLEWVEPGMHLYDSEDVADGIPECVHKLDWQLPADEQMGAPHALILHGTATYKIFHASAPFGARLSQTVTGLKPGTNALLTVPVQAHLHGDGDPWGAEVGVWVDQVNGKWWPAELLGDHTWNMLKVPFVVNSDGAAEVEILVKSKWHHAKDFFIDHVVLEAQKDDTPPEPPPGDTLVLDVPANITKIELRILR